jgi:hypothetical protein
MVISAILYMYVLACVCMYAHRHGCEAMHGCVGVCVCACTGRMLTVIAARPSVCVWINFLWSFSLVRCEKKGISLKEESDGFRA